MVNENNNKNEVNANNCDATREDGGSHNTSHKDEGEQTIYDGLEAFLDSRDNDLEEDDMPMKNVMMMNVTTTVIITTSTTRPPTQMPYKLTILIKHQ